jgi:hypothetical protein
MGDLSTVQRLLDRERWKPSSSGKAMLVAQVTVEEAVCLAPDSQEGRAAVERWLLERSLETPPTTALLMFIFDGKRTVKGFIEVSLELGVFQWSGPNLM